MRRTFWLSAAQKAGTPPELLPRCHVLRSWMSLGLGLGLGLGPGLEIGFLTRVVLDEGDAALAAVLV